jgi:ABC-2 type transport system permease protein
MIAALKAELRKVLSVRSTYVIIALTLAISVALVSFWVYGYKDVSHAQLSTGVLREALFTAIGPAGVFLSFLAILQVGHEYRYNTILYSLTSVNSRLKVLFAKWLVVTVITVIIAAVTTLLSAGGFYIGQHLAHIATLPQTVPVADFVWRAAVSIIGSVTFAYIIVILLRSLVGAFAVVLVLPTTVETLLSILLKDNAKYLPYTALGNLTGTGAPNAPVPANSLLIVLIYLIAFGGLATILFWRRDAN